MDPVKKKATYTADYIKGDWHTAVYLDNPHTDNLLTAFLNLGAEHWTLRRRVMVLEKLIADRKVISPAALEAYVPSADETAAWDKERDDFIERVFSVFSRETGPIADSMPTKRTAPFV